MIPYAIEPYWPRYHVGYLQAVGALRLLCEQLDPAITCEPLEGGMRFGFSLPAEAAEEFWRDKYEPSAIYSPWNARSFGAGFGHSLEAARSVPQLAAYAAAVDASGERFGGVKPAKKSVNKRERSPKSLQLESLVSGETRLSPSHTQWARACWRLEPVAGKRGQPASLKPHARPLCGAGGNECSLDYGSLFLRAAVAWYAGARDRGKWSLGGFAWPDLSSLDVGFSLSDTADYWLRWSAFDVLLLLEGALSFAAPADAAVLQEPWHEHTGKPRGRAWLPVWDGPVTWGQLAPLLAGGWDRWIARDKREPTTEFGTPPAPGYAPPAVKRLAWAKWGADGKMLRASCGGAFRETSHLRPVELRLVHSPDEAGFWYASLPDADDWASELGEYEDVRDAGQRAAREVYGDALVLRVRHATAE